MSVHPGVQAADAAARQAGLDPTGAVLVRDATTFLVRLPSADAVARVRAPMLRAQARREVAAAAALDLARFPASRLVGAGQQPIDTAWGTVTLFGWVEGDGRSVGPDQLGRLARRLHDATDADQSSTLPDLDPVRASLQAIEQAVQGDACSPSEMDLLLAAADSLGAQWRRTSGEDPLGTGFVHGDLHAGNVVSTSTGPVLIDLELAGWGPRSYDLAPTAVAARRYGAPQHTVDEACAAYGLDPRGWPGFRVLCCVYELWVTSWSLAHRHASLGAAREASRRVALWRDGRAPDWTRL